jgi:hypothetical protein
MAKMLTVEYTTSFEYDELPVQTATGKLSVPNTSLAARRAVEAARKKFKNARPRSIVIVLSLIGES